MTDQREAARAFNDWLNKRSREILLIASALTIAGFYFFSPNFHNEISSGSGESLQLILGFIALLMTAMIAIGQIQRGNKQAEKADAKVDALEAKVREDPTNPQIVWNLARAALERYLDRNLRQVRWIFALTVAVMVCGMALVVVGVWRAIQFPDSIAPSYLAALAGVLIQFIGGTFLIIYRSTMEQAKSYVDVLERINAVGMSINILDAIKDDDRMHNEGRAAIARDLLGMYGIHTPSAFRKRKVKRNAGKPGSGGGG
jgi:hypothetical protein